MTLLLVHRPHFEEQGSNMSTYVVMSTYEHSLNGTSFWKNFHCSPSIYSSDLNMMKVTSREVRFSSATKNIDRVLEIVTSWSLFYFKHKRCLKANIGKEEVFNSCWIITHIFNKWTGTVPAPEARCYQWLWSECVASFSQILKIAICSLCLPHTYTAIPQALSVNGNIFQQNCNSAITLKITKKILL